MESNHKNVFISFSSKQQDEALRVCNIIEENGLSCFISCRDLVAGEIYAEQLISNIANCNTVVLLLSNDSNNSPHVLREIEYAVSHDIPVIVYSVEECTLSKSMEYFLMTHQWLLPSSDRDVKLIKSIRHKVKSSSDTPSSDLPEPKIKISSSSKKKSNVPLILSLIIAILVIVVLLAIIFATNMQSNNANKNQKEIGELEEIEDEDELVIPEFELGDTVEFGCYNGETIEWRVIKIDKDDQTMMLVSKYILSMKTYDAAEGGEYNKYDDIDYWSFENSNVDDEELLIKIRGNNDWSSSNIRTWLNSDAEKVTYPDQAPTRKAVGLNSYDTEHGFLYEFSDDELDAIEPTSIKTPANTFSTNVKNGQVKSVDSVFLLSYEELDLLEAAGMSLYAKPTESCIASDNRPDGYVSFVNDLKIEEYYWWLRDSDGSKINHAYFVVTPYEEKYDVLTDSVGACAYGIRPAMWVDMTSEVFAED